MEGTLLLVEPLARSRPMEVTLLVLVKPEPLVRSCPRMKSRSMNGRMLLVEPHRRHAHEGRDSSTTSAMMSAHTALVLVWLPAPELPQTARRSGQLGLGLRRSLIQSATVPQLPARGARTTVILWHGPNWATLDV
jgi:hypothetical protein